MACSDFVMIEPSEKLRSFMGRHSLTQREVAEVAQVSIKTVESWLADPASANFRRMPARALALVQFALPQFLRRRRKEK